MPSQQRFEGSDLEDLLEDVRTRFGRDVAIVEANKLRKGGVGGFFAKELYEVVVETDEPASTPARSLLDLVDEVDDGPAPAVPRNRDGLASEETVQALLRMTEDIRVEEPGDGTAMASLLARLGEDRERTSAPIAPTEATVSTDGEAFAQVLGRIARDTASDVASDDAPFRSFADAARSAPRRSASRGTVSPGPATARSDADRAPVRGQRVRPEAKPAVPEILDRTSLVRLGLPEAVARGATSAPDRLGSLVELAETFPTPRRLPDTGDTVIALIGDRAGMDRAVAWVQDHLGLAPDTLMLATRAESHVFPASRRIAGYDDASVQRQSWRRRRRPVLVAIDQAVSLQGTTWARHVLDALEPAAVWGVVSASRKPEDIVEWGERLGGIDAIALHGTEDTMSPAAALTTGLPVSLIDGHAATPARWAAVLDERLAA